MENLAWKGFKQGKWQEEIDVRDFIQTNYTLYEGDSSFLSKATQRTNELMGKLNLLFKSEREKGGVLDVDTETVSSLSAFKPGYLDKEKELIVDKKKKDRLESDPSYLFFHFFGCYFFRLVSASGFCAIAFSISRLLTWV